MKYAFWFATICISYYATGKLGIQFGATASIATPIWAPSGIAVAALCLLGSRYWPAITISAFFTNFSNSENLVVAISGAFGNSAEALLAYWLLTLSRFDRDLSTVADVLKLFVLGSVIPGILAASFGTTSLLFQGMILPGDFVRTFIVWLVGDTMGIMIVFPILATVSDFFIRPKGVEATPYPKRKFWELIAIVTACSVFGFIIFCTPKVSTPFSFPQAYFVSPFIVWAAMRLRRGGTSLVICIFSTLAMVGTALGLGPFVEVSVDPKQSFLTLELFLLFVTVPTYCFMAVNIQLQDRTKALVRLNTDLEQFASFASHDLKEPLRTIQSWLDILKKDCFSKFDAEHLKYSEFIISAARRMSRIIDSLLTYAKVGRQQASLSLIDLKVPLQESIENLSGEIEESHLRIEIGPLIQARADSVLVAQVFQNLISNAIKHGRSSNPLIHIQSRLAGTEVITEVRDNGPGIQERDLERIFQPFVRMPSHKDADGSGIGLALCRRIVEKLGGRIWAESTLGQGTSFYFALPAT